VSFCWLKILSCTRFPFFSDVCQVFAFYSFCSDNENLKKDAATAPSVEAKPADEPSFQEAALVVKSKEAPAKRVSSSRGSKRLKKATDASTSLNAHRPMSSSDNVSTNPGVLLCSLLELSYSCLPFDRF
jgi:hypothetical protein